MDFAQIEFARASTAKDDPDVVARTPDRRAGSVRRTMSIDVTWPGGADMASHIACTGRDIRTSRAKAPPELLAHDRLWAAAEHRLLVALRSAPPRAGLAQLVGARAGGHLRSALNAALPEERDAGSPLFLCLDDLAGTTLVAGWAWSHWRDDWFERDAAAVTRRVQSMEGACFGFRPGSSALDPAVHQADNARSRAVALLPRGDDPDGWHEMPAADGIAFRRARRLDLWREGGQLHIDASFQDSASTPDGRRMALHEYRLFATARDGILSSLHAIPGALPFQECPSAALHVETLVGTPLRDLREIVLLKFARTAGCTHLNDTLRALAEIPCLAERL